MTKRFSREFVFLLLNLVSISNAQTDPATRPVVNQTQSSAYEVKIDNFSFTPATLTVPAGAKITWTNGDDIPHNIVSSDQKFKSKALDTGDSFSTSLDSPGTYQYFCGLHPKMVGKIIVQAAK